MFSLCFGAGALTLGEQMATIQEAVTCSTSFCFCLFLPGILGNGREGSGFIKTEETEKEVKLAVVRVNRVGLYVIELHGESQGAKHR